MVKTSSLLGLFATLTLAATGVSADFGRAVPAGGRQIMSGSGTLFSGVTIEYKSVLIAAGESRGSLGEGGISVPRFGNTIHRYMIDRGSGSYFGYDMVIAGNATNGYLAAFQTLSDAAGLLKRHAGGASLKPMPPPKFPPPQAMRDGDIIELDLMVSPDGKHRLTDYIRILSHRPEPAPARTTAKARDCTFDDGPIHFKFDDMRVLINGRPFNKALYWDDPTGGTFWFAIPRQGRYILSLAPHDGFVKAGEARDNVILFQDGGQQYEFRTMRAIVGTGGAFNLYMRHDPAYQPEPYRKDAIICGMGRLENLLPK